jgi:hypothetical protein
MEAVPDSAVVAAAAARGSAVADVRLFQFHMWYELFRKHTIKSRIVSLSAEFIEYLNQDGVILPTEAVTSRPRNRSPGSDDQCDDDVRSVHTVSDDDTASAPSFPVLSQAIREAMEQLGGEVFIKLNWSCPSDAAWMLGTMDGCLKCRSLSEVYLLLKSSDRIQYDIGHMLPSSTHTLSEDDNVNNYNGVPIDYTLVVKQWRNINPSMEFRLFVKENRLIGICQRDCYTYYPFLLTEIRTITRPLIDFYLSNVHSKFICDCYALDVYLTANHTVKIVDFNVFGFPTDSLLFEWDQLNTRVVIIEEPDVRIIKSESEVLIDTRGVGRGPIDVSLAPDFHRFMEICKAQAVEE